MKTYNDVKKEQQEFKKGNMHLEAAPLRIRYLKEIASITQRNVISYYSSFLMDPLNVTSDIEDQDMVGFTNSVSNMDTSVGLDLILNTPGGSVEAAEAIIKYLHSKFKDIKVIVPQAALSAGTLIAASADSIIMSEGATLGPTDPQFFSGIPASNILEEFKEAKSDIEENPKNKDYWELRLKAYPVGFNSYVKESIDIVKDDLYSWLSSFMFKELDEAKKKDTIKPIINSLLYPKKSHSYHFSRKECESMGLKIVRLEEIENGKLLNNIMYLHYMYMLSFEDGKPGKLIEGCNDTSYFIKAKKRQK